MNAVWERAVKNSADPERAAQYGGQLAAVLPSDYFAKILPEQAGALAALLSGSRALAELLLSRPDWIDTIDYERLLRPRSRQGLRREAIPFVQGAIKAGDHPGGLQKLREFRQREMLRIAARDLAGLGNVPEVTEEISNVADICIHGVYEILLAQLTQRYGIPCMQDPATERWQASTFCILGMGKLGGQELNYSSDIDVLFVYSGEGEVFKSVPGRSGKTARPVMPNHQFYARLAEGIIAECTRMTPEGFLFRIDLRLRPEGKSAPLARSLSSYENYYAQYGQTWERMMLIKARGVGGDEGLAAEFLEMIQPFRYPRSISEQIPHEVGEMKQRIESEVVRAGEIERNVKLGRGGIREIEFLVQTQQVLLAGRLPFLQGAKTLPALDKMRDYKLMEAKQAEDLKRAYCFLRNVEHRLQMEDNRQTHTIPLDLPVRERLARLMGFGGRAEFESELQGHKDRVRASYHQFIGTGGAAHGSGTNGYSSERLPVEVEASGEEWQRILAEHSFRDPERCVKLVKEFVQGPGFGHRSARTLDHSIQLMARFLAWCPRKGAAAPPEPFLSDPDRVLARLDSFVANYGARAMLYDAWVSNPSLFKLLLLAFDRSEFLAELAIRVPDLIDEIEQSGQLRRRKTTPQILDDLRPGIDDEDQHFWLRRYFQAEQMRVGLRDILGIADAQQTQAEISALADAFLIYALEVVTKKHRLRTAPFAIIGLGKLGGGELTYGSDLDILFVAADSVRNLPALQKLAVEVMDLLSKRTGHGTTFATDARLRPDGEKGLLVNTLSAHAEYYRKRAMLWEIQSLSRFRPVTGQPTVLKGFAQMARAVTDFTGPGREIAAYGPDWKSEVHRMRMRIEKERTPGGKDPLAIKTGRGGLMDIEFVAQALCLEHGWTEPNTLAAIQRGAREGRLPRDSADILAENYRRLMRIERILRRWSFEPESLLPDDPAPFYRVAARCGFQNSEVFQEAVTGYRAAIRAEYARYFNVEVAAP